jgi:hypothetical protein
MRDTQIFTTGVGVVILRWIVKQEYHVAFEAFCVFNKKKYLLIHKGLFGKMLCKQYIGNHLIVYGSPLSRKGKMAIYDCSHKPIDLFKVHPTGLSYPPESLR